MMARYNMRIKREKRVYKGEPMSKPEQLGTCRCGHSEIDHLNPLYEGGCQTCACARFVQLREGEMPQFCTGVQINVQPR